MSRVIVVGGGAAGCMAAIAAGKAGHQVTLLEKNEKLGKKIYITGKGRCNVTNASDLEVIFKNIVTNSRFMYSSLYGFTNEDTMELFKEAGLALKVERGNRVFPVSDKASDVIKALHDLLNRYRVNVFYNRTVRELIIKESDEGPVCRGVITDDNRRREADCVIVCTGGLSYPSTGSTGDGYIFARKAGHKVTETGPALVPFECEEIETVKALQGLSLKNVNVTIKNGKKKLYEEFGEMLFTHFGLSGPCMLSGASLCAKQLKKGNLMLHIDLKPALTREQLDARLLREFKDAKNKQISNVLGSLYPSSLVPVILARADIPADKAIHDVTKQDRNRLIEVTKDFVFVLTGLRGYNEAIITQGGIHVKEINPTTMESKLVKGLRFAGEVLDVDALTGGYNLQIAWSSGYAAGSSIE